MSRPPSYHLDQLDKRFDLIKRNRRDDRELLAEIADCERDIENLRRSLEEIRREAGNIWERLKP